MMKLMKILSILILFFITSCVYNPQRPDIVESSSAQRVQTVQTAIVVDVKSIIISGDRETGAIAGGVIGGCIGLALGGYLYQEYLKKNQQNNSQPSPVVPDDIEIPENKSDSSDYSI